MPRVVQSKQDPLPIHPDDQKEFLLAQVEKESHALLRPEDVERITYYRQVVDLLKVIRRSSITPLGTATGDATPLGTSNILSIFFLQAIDLDYLQPFDISMMDKILDLVPEELRSHWEFRFFYEKFLNKLKKYYYNALRKAILNYDLCDVVERRRLDIQTLPHEWPPIIIRAPIPWHTNVTIAKHRLSNHYHLGSEIQIALRVLWQTE